MAVSRRTTLILSATATAVTLGVVGAVVLVRGDTPAPSIAPLAAADGAASGGHVADPWAEYEERCGPVMADVQGPSEEELAQMREDNEKLMAALDETGVAYEVVTDPGGWEYLEPADGDFEAFERAVGEFWSGHEAEGPGEEHLAAMREQNEELTAHLDEQGIAYEIVDEGDGWEYVQPSTDEGFRAMDDFWHEQEREDVRTRAGERGLDVDAVMACFEEERELSGMHAFDDPFPMFMDMRTASEQKRLAEALIAAFDEAGIGYQRLDVPVLTWDREDPETTELVERIAGEHGYGMDTAEAEVMLEGEVVEMEPDGAPAD